MSKILYIAGYGRSGSTILSIVLGNHSHMVHVGEVAHIFDDWGDDRRLCSCGLRYDKCDFWRDFLADCSFTDDPKRRVQKIEGISFFPQLLLGWLDGETAAMYRAYNTRLFEYIEDRSGKPIVVDSSKSSRTRLGRFLALSRVAGQEVYVLHLVRNGWAVMESLTVTGSNRALEGFGTLSYAGLRTVLGWLNANLWISLLGKRIGEKRYLLLRYEDFISDPVSALGRIGRFCDVDMTMVANRISSDDGFATGHIVGGNRIRFKQTVKVKTHLAENHVDRLKSRHRLLFRIFGSWLNRRYGYE